MMVVKEKTKEWKRSRRMWKEEEATELEEVVTNNNDCSSSKSIEHHQIYPVFMSFL